MIPEDIGLARSDGPLYSSFSTKSIVGERHLCPECGLDKGIAFPAAVSRLITNASSWHPGLGGTNLSMAIP